jgi:MtN3 and saliva related transmembrane protein
MFATCIKFLFSISFIANAGFFIPQIIKLYKTKNASGVSLPMFLGFNAIQLVSVLYGYTKGDFILMGGFSLSLIACGLVSILIFIYRKDKHEKN